jgi:hypothetical protein
MKKSEVIQSDVGRPSKKDDKSKDDEFTRHGLENSKGGKGELKKIVQLIAGRDKSSYDYGDIKNLTKSELVTIALQCQGKKMKVNTKTDYKYRSDTEINKMNEDELREMLNEMIGREPGTYKYCESSWSKKKLIDFILTCHGSSLPKDLGNKVFVGGGWTL